MLKAAQKKKVAKLLASATTPMTRVQSRQITTHYQYDQELIEWHKRKDIMDTNIFSRKNVGIFKLNREHRYNMLSTNHIKNVRRGIETLNMDDDVRLIYMTTEKGEHFCNGTDFRQILHYKKENNYDQIAAYLTDLYSLQTQVAKLNKPMIVVAPGHSFNSGATLLSASALPMTTLDSKLSFNEVCFGFVPHAGATFYLSRLPNEFGTFLALTGLPLVGVDAMEYKLVDLLVHKQSKEFDKELQILVDALVKPYTDGNLKTDFHDEVPWLEYLDFKAEEKGGRLESDILEAQKRSLKDTVNEDFVEPRDRKPSLTGEADYKYKKLMERYNALRHPKQELGYFDFDELIHQNYFHHVLSNVKAYIGDPHPQNAKTFMRYGQVIHRCFYSETVEEIMDNLRREDTPFTRLCLESMEKNSMLSMKIALKMVRKAVNLDYRGAMELEINTALNKIQDKDFDLGISEVLMKPGKHGSSPAFSRDISDELVESYFEKNPRSKDVRLDVVENALLPTRFYFEKYSDQVRLWLNEESTTQPWIRDDFEFELPDALREHGIDLRDRALTQKSARKQMKDAETLQRREMTFNNRLSQLINDDKLRTSYFDKIDNEVSKFTNDSSAFYKMVNQQIYKVYEEGFLENLQKIYTKSKEANSLEKRRMYVRLKKFMFKSRILTYMGEEADRAYKQVLSMPQKEIHLTERWDQTYREMNHPDLERSFLWQLSKAVGKVNIAPLELAKQYITNPEMRKSMSLYTFDKEELIKLRRDILENPQKYERMLVSGGINGGSGIYEPKDRLIREEIKAEEYEYWYRAVNDGRTPMDSLPYYMEYLYYKEFVENVEKNTVETLKMTVTRLIADFEHDEQGANKVVQFEQANGSESKREALQRLMTILGQPDQNPKVASQQDKKQLPGIKTTDKPVSLNQLAGSNKDIKRSLRGLVDQDKELRALFSPQSEGSQNALVENFREELLSQFASLMELVLLNKYQGVPVSKEVLEKRYQQLTNPKHADADNTVQQKLRVIDAYLNHANFQNFMTEALHVVKPYFLKMIQARLYDEERRVLDGIKSEATAKDILFFYLMNILHPEIRKHPVTERLLTFNENRDQQELLGHLVPTGTEKYRFRQFLREMGHSRPDKNAQTVEEKEQLLDKQTREEYKQIQDFKKKAEDQANEWEQQTEKEKQRQLKTPFDEEAVDRDMQTFPQYNVEEYTPQELDVMFEFAAQAERIIDYIEDNQEAIQREFTAHDWMHVFAMSVSEYGLDMQANFRHCLPAEKYLNTDHLKEMQNIFRGNRTIGWKDLAIYADYLKGFGEALEESQRLLTLRDKRLGPNDSMMQFFGSHMIPSPQDAQLQLSQDRVFNILTDMNATNKSHQKDKQSKYSYGYVQSGQDRLRQEYLDFKKLQSKIGRASELEQSVQALSTRAPQEIKDLVAQIFEGKPHYYDLEKLQKLLLNKKYSEINIDALLDKEALIQDVSRGKLLSNFTSNYGNTKVDVLTLAETKAAILADEGNIVGSDNKIKRLIGIVIDFVNKQLRQVPNDRRKEITIAQFLSKFNHLDLTSLQSVADNILKRSIEEALGKQTHLLVGAHGSALNGEQVTVDWQYADIRTNPLVQKQVDNNFGSDKSNQAAKGNSTGAQEGGNPKIDEILNQAQSSKDHNNAMPRGVVSVNPVTGVLEAASEKDFETKRILRDARQSVEMKEDFEPTRAYFENLILEQYSSAKFDEQQLTDLISQYMELRVKECMLRDGFKTKALGNNGHYYLKSLKEQVMEELKINQPSDVEDFSYAKLVADPDFRFVMEGKYNTNSVNNLDALGYDNLEKRLENQAETNSQENRQLAHETFFDKLLADYFLQKRSQYVKTNELIEDLNNQFGKKAALFPEGHPLSNKDPRGTDPNKFPFVGTPNMSFALLQQSIEKEDEPHLDPTNAVSFMELDSITARALQGGMNGLSEQLRTPIPKELVDIPQYFKPFDVRRPPEQYVQDKLSDIISQIFDARRKIEKTLTRRELLAYDKMLTKYLVKDQLLPKLISEIDADKNQLFQLQQLSDRSVERQGDDFAQYAKSRNQQAKENNEIKNEDALYKWLSYTGMLDKDRRTNERENERTGDVALNIHSFEHFYEAELLADAKKPPRPIVAEEYEPKTSLENLINSKRKFRTIDEQKDNYFAEFKIYKQNKRETQDRNEMFYVLEQFFAAAKSKPDQGDKAQQAIRDYFSDTENTYFFDKNKIR